LPRRKRITELSEADKEEMRGELDIAAVFQVVESIMKDVRERGDAALIEYTERFDGVSLSKNEIEVGDEEIKAAESDIDDALKDSILLAADAISAFHTRQKSKSWFEDFSFAGSPGGSRSVNRSSSSFVARGSTGNIILGDVFVPLERVGVYVPASYFSTALMCVIPAKVAGVPHVIMCTPPRRGGNIDSATLFAAHIAGASRIFRVGGAQAIAALAFGTETIPKVQKIVGPGNIYVTAAKILLRKLTRTEIDFPAGPSEVMIIADDSAPPDLVAADMMAQAEHGKHSKALLLTDSNYLASAVEREIMTAIEREIMNNCEEQFWILTGSMDECVEFANEYAPEHLEIVVRSPFDVLKKVRNAGSVFIGVFSPVAAGDYATGANHVLPTAGYASVLSGLDVFHFMRRMTVQIISREGLRMLKDAIVRMARAEGMPLHAHSVEARFTRSE